MKVMKKCGLSALQRSPHSLIPRPICALRLNIRVKEKKRMFGSRFSGSQLNLLIGFHQLQDCQDFLDQFLANLSASGEVSAAVMQDCWSSFEQVGTQKGEYGQMSTRLMRVRSEERSCVMATGRSLQRIEITSGMEFVPTSNSSRKRARKRRVKKESELKESPLDDRTGQQLVKADRMTEARRTSSRETCSRRVDGTALSAEPYVCSPGTGLVSACGTSEGPGSHCSVSESAVSPSDGNSSLSNAGRRTYALRPRRKHLQSPSLSSAERVDILAEYRPPQNQDATSAAVTYSEPLVSLRDECREKTQSTSGREPPLYHRKDSGVFAGRLKANPLRHLAALLRSKLLFHGDFRNLLELANEIHLEAKEKHNTTLRRIYDVVNVTEAAGLLERAIVSRSGRKKLPKGSASGSLIRWCRPPPTIDARTTDVTILHNRLFQKEEEVKDLEEEVELLENLMRHRKVRFASAKSADMASDSTSTQFYTSEHAVKSTSNQLLYSSASVGIEIPFCLLKASRRSDDRSFEVCTYTDEYGTQFQGTISSDHEIEPYEWRWILREMLRVSDSSLSTLTDNENDEFLMQNYAV